MHVLEVITVTKKILRPKQAMARLGIGKTKFYEDRKNGRLPLKPVPLGRRAVGYIEDEIDAVIEKLRAERDRDGNQTIPEQSPDPPDEDDDPWPRSRG
jgi:predicted DNA-binding transcriptional regulator AlpA